MQESFLHPMWVDSGTSSRQNYIRAEIKAREVLEAGNVHLIK